MTVTSDLTPEVDEVFTRIARVVRRANEFVLGFAKCNSPIQQRQLSRMLLERLSGKRAVEITLDEPIISLLDELKAVIDVNYPPAFVNVFGLEKSICAQEDYSPALGRLNNDRDLIRRACPAVLLIWLPDYALDKMVLSAPDFWAWRSGVYEFPTNLVDWQDDSLALLTMNGSGITSLIESEKQQEIQRLEELIRTAKSLPYQNNKAKEVVARLLHQLGELHDSLGDWQKASQCFSESLSTWTEINDKAGMATVLNSLGAVEENKGNLAEAQRLYEQSLYLAEEVNNKHGLAASKYHLGDIYARRGNFSEALRFYNQCLQLLDELANENSEDFLLKVSVLSGIGYLHVQNGEWTKALELYQRLLSSLTQRTDKNLTAKTLFNIGTIRLYQGNFEEAMQLSQGSLEIAQELGDKYMASVALLQLGILKFQQTSYREASDYFYRAFTILRQLQSPLIQTVNNWLKNVQTQVGVEQFQEWMQQAHRSQPQPVS